MSGTWDRLASIVLLLSAIGLLMIVSIRMSPMLFAFLRESPAPSWGELSETQAGGFSLVTADDDTLSFPESGRVNLIVAYETTCVFCEASMDSWGRALARSCGATVVFASPEPTEIQSAYWTSRRSTLDDSCGDVVIGEIVDKTEFSVDYRITGTPTHYLVDSDGRLTSIWVGSAEGEEAGDSLIAGIERTIASSGS